MKVSRLALLAAAALLPGRVASQSPESQIIIAEDPAQSDGYETFDESQNVQGTAPAPDKQSTTTTQPTAPISTAPVLTAANLPRFMLVATNLNNACVVAKSHASGPWAPMYQNCAPNPDTQWISEKGRLVTAYHLGTGPACLTWYPKPIAPVPGAPYAPTQPYVGLKPCALKDPPAPNQLWLLNGPRILSADGRCWSANAPVNLMTCDPVAPRQIWTVKKIN